MNATAFCHHYSSMFILICLPIESFCFFDSNLFIWNRKFSYHWFTSQTQNIKILHSVLLMLLAIFFHWFFLISSSPLPIWNAETITLQSISKNRPCVSTTTLIDIKSHAVLLKLIDHCVHFKSTEKPKALVICDAIGNIVFCHYIEID